MRNYGINICFAVILYIILSATSVVKAESIKVPLHSNWKFHNIKEQKFYTAQIPGSVYTDLMQHHVIPDPFTGMNEKKVQWVDSVTWEYSCNFQLPSSLKKFSHFNIEFEGLDTYADVYLNDSLILSCDNMFRAWNTEITKLIKKKNNTLRIVFHPAILRTNELAKQFTFEIPGGNRAFARKAQYQFGWDWGPALAGCGIWKPVNIIGWNDFLIEDITLQTLRANADSALLQFTGNIFLDQERHLNISAKSGNTPLFFVTAASYSTGRLISITYRFKISHPQLWWCNGKGRPATTPFDFEFECNQKKETRNIQFGIRTVEVVRDKDPAGESFYFKLNGKPVFIKGANWIPADFFPSRLKREDYASLLLSCKNAGMNMIRVWGGGIYESDDFYSLCDSLGIMVWQDFMFAGAMIPPDIHLFNNIRNEAAYQLKRLSVYSCIVLWCGNNEISEAWHNWGWQQQYHLTSKDSFLLWNNYRYLTDDILGRKIAEINPSVPFWPSSPSNGWGRKKAYTEGDVHYWGVWWGNELFSSYYTHVGRFVSEYGFQAAPDAFTRSSFSSDGKQISKADWLTHQKHPTGYQNIDTIIQQFYPAAKDSNQYWWLTQVVQADAMKAAIDAHRGAMPYCMGTMFWQINDCWPVVSWSVLDYYKRPKLSYYALEEFYAPVLLTSRIVQDSIQIRLINDDTLLHKGTLSLTWTDYNGNLLMHEEYSALAEAGTVSITRIPFKDNSLASRAFLYVEFRDDNTLMQLSDIAFPHSLKNSKIQETKPSITIHALNTPGMYSCEISGSRPSFYTTLIASQPDVKFDKNGMHIMPGEKKTILIYSSLSIDELRKSVQVYNLNMLY
ncbi:MAG: glycoside hydrolase family 2 TIM barrel-domain containing protein [Bacteroidia bacterium]